MQTGISRSVLHMSRESKKIHSHIYIICTRNVMCTVNDHSDVSRSYSYITNKEIKLERRPI